jgi:hypothetical protein
MTESKRYLRALRNTLPRSLRRRVVAELRSHLAEGIAAERARGLDREEAERVTIARLGSPEQLAAQFSADAGQPVARRAAPASRRTVTALAGLAAVAVVAAVAGLAVTHTRHHPSGSTSQRTAATATATLPSGTVVLPRSAVTPLQIAVARRVSPEAQSVATLVLQLTRNVRLHRIVLNNLHRSR